MTISLEEHVAREPELLPCPFCGSRMLFRAALWPSDGDRDGFIHAEPTECPLGDFSDGSSDRSIIGKWNARAAIAAVHELEGAEPGPHGNPDYCCDNGNFGEAHECQKQNAPDPAEAMRAKCEAKGRLDTWKHIRGKSNPVGSAKAFADAAIAALKGNGEWR